MCCLYAPYINYINYFRPDLRHSAICRVSRIILSHITCSTQTPVFVTIGVLTSSTINTLVCCDARIIKLTVLAVESFKTVALVQRITHVATFGGVLARSVIAGIKPFTFLTEVTAITGTFVFVIRYINAFPAVFTNRK